MADKRRSERISQNITIQLVGMQAGSSSAVAQPARTIDVSKEGALIECRSKFEPGAEVMIHNPKNLLNGMFKVIRCSLSSAGSQWIIALESPETAGVDFWALD